jgi:CBS domain-containing protein
MKVQETMSSDVRMANPKQTIREAARLMAESDCGALPVAEGDRLVGMITDRDIAIRAVAAGMSPDTPVQKVMTGGILYCYEDDELEDVSANMANIKVRRLPVLNKDKRLVGIVALSDLALADGQAGVVDALCRISTPGTTASLM